MRIQMIGLATAVVIAAAAMPVQAQDAKAAEILAATRKALGDKKLETLKTFSLQSTVQRNLGNVQTQADVEILLELPDKYLRSDVTSGPFTMNLSTGFNGDKAILPAGATPMAGGGMVIRMGSGPGMDPHAGEKPTPEQLELMNRASLRNYRQEISRLMLGWFGMAHPSLNAQYTYAGEAESPDGKAHVIDVKDADGFSARLFIDQNNHLPLMVSYQGRQGRTITNMVRNDGQARQKPAEQLSAEEAKKLKEDQDKKLNELKTAASQPAPMVEYSLFFDDWREVDGIQFPHIVRRASEGATNEEWKITKVKVNPKVDARKFDVGTK